MDKEQVIIDENNEFVVIEPSQSVDFIPVAALQVQTVQMSSTHQYHPRKKESTVDFGNAVNCKQTITRTVQLQND